MTSIILSASSGNSLSPLSIKAPYNEIPSEHKEFRMETTKYQEIIHLSVLILLPPYLLGGSDVVLEVEILEPLTVDHLAPDPGPNSGERQIRLEPIVPSPRMLLVVESTWLDGDILQNLSGMNTLPFATPMARMVVIKINSASVFWKAFLSTKPIKVMGDTYWDGFPVPVAPPSEELTNGPDPSSGTHMHLHSLDRRSKKSWHSIHQT